VPACVGVVEGPKAPETVMSLHGWTLDRRDRSDATLARSRIHHELCGCSGYSIQGDS
jgi:xanthine dehydrogenase iron-sulfur cluster and FAD-binding subunit A